MNVRLQSILLGFILSAALSVSPAGEPWERPFADAAAVLKAAQAVVPEEGQPAVILLDSHRYKIDSAGRTSAVIRRVFRVLNEQAVEDWGSLEHQYAPWHENRPVFRARVIRADGSVHWLDAKTIADSPVREFDSSIYSDNRVLRAPLPGVAVGAVVEYEITANETGPLLDAGVVREVEVSDYVPVQRVSVVVEAAREINLRVAQRNVPESAMRRETTGSETRIQWELGPFKAREEFVGNLPYDVALSPSIAFATGTSWNAVAARYEAIVNKQIQSANLKAMLGEIPKGNAMEIAARLTAQLHKDIRYTGVEFGEAAIVPRTPAEVLQRKYGDCKDKAALLVAMLRAAGLRADVALLNAGFDTDVQPDLPGLGAFNHAIVYVAGDRPIWIDATSPGTRVGDLPLPDQGRLALIANSAAASLVKTPLFTSAENERRHTFQVRMSEFGPGTFEETVEAKGFLEARLRDLYDPAEEKRTRETLQDYVKQTFQAGSLGNFQIPAKEDFSAPFRMTFQAVKARAALTQNDDAIVILHPYQVFDELPYPLSGQFDEVFEDKSEKEKRREHDFQMNGPHRIEYRYVIQPPRSFRPQRLPESKDVELGTAHYTKSYRTLPDGKVEAVFSFDSGKARLTPAEYEAVRAGIRQNLVRQPEVINFISEAAELVALGQMAKAVQLVRQAALDEPNNVGAQVRLTRMLLTAGAGEAAIELAKKTTAAAPESPAAWLALGWTHQHDDYGRRFRGTWNRAEAARGLREAIRLEPEDVIAQIDLAILLEHNERGERYKKGAELDEAIRLYREATKSLGAGIIQNNLIIALVRAGRYAEAREELKKSPPLEGIQLSLLVTALTDGAQRAIIESQNPAFDTRTRAAQLFGVGQSLMQFREYERAAEIMKAATRLLNTPGMANRLEILQKAKRHEEVKFEPNDPRYPIHRLMGEVIASKVDFEKVKALHSRRVHWQDFRKIVSEVFTTRSQVSSFVMSAGLDMDSVLDLGLSALEMESKGEEGRGYRVKVGGEAVYVMKEDGEYRIIGYDDRLDAIGEMVLELVEKGDLAAAQWWLDTVVEDVQPKGNLAGPAVKFLWAGVTKETRGLDAMRRAAAALIGMHSGAEKAIGLLQAARLKATVALEQGQIDLALCETLSRAERWKELLEMARRLGTQKIFEMDAFEFTVRAATGLKQWETIKAAAKPHLSEGERSSSAPGKVPVVVVRPSSARAQRAMARACMHAGQYDCAEEYLSKLGDMLAEEKDHLMRAWLRLLAGKADEELLKKLSARAEMFGDSADAGTWYTLGMVQLALGKPDEAHRSLLRGVEKDDLESPSAPRGLLRGGIFAAFGLSDAAAAEYAKIPAAEPSEDVARWAVLYTKQTGERAQSAAKP